MPATDSTTRTLEARRVRGIEVAVVLALLVVVLRATPWTRNLSVFSVVESYAYDLAFGLSKPEPPGDILIVEIDDKSLKELGRFQSWHRDKYAHLLAGPLAEARVVAFDILFPEADEHCQREYVNFPGLRGVDPRHELLATADDLLATAMKQHGRVVLAAHWQQAGAGDATGRDTLRRFAYPHARGRLARGQVGEALALPTATLAEAAAAVGYVDIDPDADGVYRRFRPMMIGQESLVFPHFATAIAAVAVGAAGEEIVAEVERNQYRITAASPQALVTERPLAELRSADPLSVPERGGTAASPQALVTERPLAELRSADPLSVPERGGTAASPPCPPLPRNSTSGEGGTTGQERGDADRAPMSIDPGGTTLINYCGPTGTVPRVSFVDAMRDKGARERFRDKIVIVGATAPGLYDIRPAPYRKQNRTFFGVETNANIVNSLLHRRPLRDAGNSYAWCGFALLLGLLVGVIVWTMGEALAVILSVLILVLIATPSFFAAFAFLDTWIPYGAVLLATALPLAVGLYERLTLERQLIQRQFDVYVSPDVLSELMGAPDVIRQSQRRSVTLLFADVRGSTALSENIPPEVWVAQLNEYLTQMSLAIFTFDGYLDKFMGDGIMAVWNAFGTQDGDHAELAVQAGRQMLRRLEFLNKKWENTEGRTPFRIGIGLHTGEAVMGNVGSEERMQYTAIGDVVNTASRIEGMCKQFNSEFIISEDTARLVGDQFPLRELGETEVRGRSRKVKVFEVIVESSHPIEKGEQ